MIFQHANCRRRNTAENIWHHVLECNENDQEAADRISGAGCRCLRRLTANETIIQNFTVRQAMVDIALLIGYVNGAHIVAPEGLSESKVRCIIDSLSRNARAREHHMKS
jgi:hypothetical protein